MRVLPDGQIAAVLNRLGPTGRGNTWTATRVVTLRHTHDLPVFDPTSAARDGWCTMEKAAERLEVSHTVIRTLITSGILPAEQVMATAPWVIRTMDLDAPSVRAYVHQVHQRRRGPPTPDTAQLSLTPSTT